MHSFPFGFIEGGLTHVHMYTLPLYTPVHIRQCAVSWTFQTRNSILFKNVGMECRGDLFTRKSQLSEGKNSRIPRRQKDDGLQMMTMMLLEGGPALHMSQGSLHLLMANEIQFPESQTQRQRREFNRFYLATHRRKWWSQLLGCCTTISLAAGYPKGLENWPVPHTLQVKEGRKDSRNY